MTSVRVAAESVGRAVVATGEGLGGAGGVVTLPILLAGLTRRRTRPSAAALLLAPPLIDALRRRPRMGPVAWCSLRILDDLAYASGVWRGSLRSHSLVPLLPRFSAVRRVRGRTGAPARMSSVPATVVGSQHGRPGSGRDCGWT